MPELSLGLVPAMVLPMLHRRMPPQKARLLCLGGATSAGRAMELGLVDEVVADPADLLKAARRWLRQALRVDPGSLSRLQGLEHELLGMTDHGSLTATRAASLFTYPEVRDQLRRFLDGELPAWCARPPKLNPKETP